MHLNVQSRWTLCPGRECFLQDTNIHDLFRSLAHACQAEVTPALEISTRCQAHERPNLTRTIRIGKPHRSYSFLCPHRKLPPTHPLLYSVRILITTQAILPSAIPTGSFMEHNPAEDDPPPGLAPPQPRIEILDDLGSGNLAKSWHPDDPNAANEIQLHDVRQGGRRSTV